MLSCSNQHPVWRQILMGFYMIYLIASYTLQFVIIGATFSSIVIFLVYVLNQLLIESGSSFLNSIATDNLPKQILFGTYLVLVFITMFISLTLPVEKGIGYFRFVAVVFSIIS